MYKVNSFLKKERKKKDPYLYLHITGQFAQKMTVHGNHLTWYSDIVQICG